MDNCRDVWDPNTLEYFFSASWRGAEEAALVMFRLNYSSFGDALSTRHGLLLNATAQIVGNRLSQSLDHGQWQLEVRRLFAMSLLRARMEMLAVVRGTRANYPGYNDILPPAHRGFCRKFMFVAKGYVDLSFVGILLAAILPPLLGLLGVEFMEKPTVVWFIVGVSRLAVLAIGMAATKIMEFVDWLAARIHETL
jgi:hypothetical protein